jgi:3'(2'), 5'-bisphosphate nucleotidase
MTSSYERERECAVRAVGDAAILCQAVRRHLAVSALEKSDLSPVTVADFGSQALICQLLAEHFPADPVIAEEDSAELRRDHTAWDEVIRAVRAFRPGADSESVCHWIDHGGARDYADRFWTLDPIDGTKGFLRAEQYAVSLALLVGGRIELAAMACPNLPMTAGTGFLGAIFLAERGHGAWMLPLDGTSPAGPAVPIRVSSRDDPAAARFCESVESAHSAHSASAEVAKLLGITAPPVRMDSQAKYAVVARGEADIYLRLPTRADYREKIWDHAGGVLIVEEAGGRVTDIWGHSLDFTRGRELTLNQGILATSGPLHDRVLAALEILRHNRNNEIT